jgi:hypothetical protein
VNLYKIVIGLAITAPNLTFHSFDLKNPNPVVLSGGKAKQRSLQVRDYKFCGTFEERFNKGGEAWILNKISQNYGDPLWTA